MRESAVRPCELSGHASDENKRSASKKNRRSRRSRRRTATPATRAPASTRTPPTTTAKGGSGDGPEYTGPVQVVGPDDYDLDSDGDGSACES